MKIAYSFLLLVVVSFLAISEATGRLMIVLLDGFRWDYVDHYDLPNFKRFYTHGSRAGRVQSNFPTLSYPNYYTLMTGLHTEKHGMSTNYMYDVLTKEYFLMGTNPEQYHSHWWTSAEPLWVTLEKRGKQVFTYFWPGSEVLIHDTRPTNFTPYDPNRPQTYEEFVWAMETGVTSLLSGKVELVGVFLQKIDDLGHLYGPFSAPLGKALTRVDGVMGTALDRIQKDGQTNIMVVSDHGMTDIDVSRTINLTSVLTPDLYTTITEIGALCKIYLRDNSLEEKVYQLLKDFSPHMTVYRRRDIPDRWHFKDGKHVPGIVCVADIGWYILHPDAPLFMHDAKTGKLKRATHGYDNTETDMGGIFYALGPHFQPASMVKSIRIIDLYNLMCDILTTTPLPNNGTVEAFQPLLASTAATTKVFTFLFVAVIFIVTISTIVFLPLYMSRKVKDV